MLLYRLLTDLTTPIIALYLRHRRMLGKEDAARFGERLGKASKDRGKGPLVWCHAASVGEALSVLSLIQRLKEKYPAWQFLLTTGTVSSSRLLATRLPLGIIHQYVPIDRWPYITRFLDHWRPDLILWVESELWPNILTAIRKRSIPTILLNARMSKKSFGHWSLFKGCAKKLMETFSLCLAQTQEVKEYFAALGARDVRCIGNLKYAADPLPFEEKELSRLKELTADRKAWLMASTHPGEEEIAIAAHKDLKKKWPSVLTIIVPRHAKRGDDIAKLIAEKGLTCSRRSLGENITAKTDVYLADTMGELGLFYRLTPLTCLGGTFTWDGHNPIEAAQCGSALIFGPRMTNFEEITKEFLSSNAALQILSAEELPAAIGGLMYDPKNVSLMANAAYAVTENKRAVLVETLALLQPYFEKSHEDP